MPEACEDGGDADPITDDEEEDDELIILSQRPLGYQPRHERRTANGTRSLRRRPFLIFDKMEARGYKQLKNSPQHERTPTASRYQPGDGFSGREAKPNGSNLLTRTGKQAVTSSHVGILDLTQTDPTPAAKKRHIRRANLNDNSFAPAPTKKARRPLEPKDANRQLRPMAETRIKMEKNNSPLSAVVETRARPTVQWESLKHAQDNQVQIVVPKGTVPENIFCENIAPEDGHSHVNINQDFDPDDEDEVDMIIVERSDDFPEDPDPDTTLQHDGEVGAEGQDSYGTHVSITPLQQLRIRAHSVSPESPSRRREVGGDFVSVERPFRRVNTQ